MKVLQITNNHPTQNLPIFGIFVKEQIESLSDIGLQNDILFINGREKGKWAYFKGILEIRRTLKKREDYDVIHCHHALSALCLILSGRCLKNKVVVSFQNDPAHELGSWIYKLIKWNSSKRIFKNRSSFMKDYDDVYLPNGVNTDFFKPIEKKLARKKLGLDLEAIYILFVSSNFIRAQKRYDRFKETIEILRKRYGYAKIDEIQLVNVSRELIPLYFNAANVHLLTSDFEGSPNSVKEAMACNIPVVSTDVGNVKELLASVDGSYVALDKAADKLAVLVDLALKKKTNDGRKILNKKNLDMFSVAKKIDKIYTSIV